MQFTVPHLAALRSGTRLVAEVEATSPNRRAWVVILPEKADLDVQAKREGWKPSIVDRSFEVYLAEYNLSAIEEDRDLDPTTDVCERARVKVVGEDALQKLLDEWSITGDMVKYTWSTDYPL